MSHIGSLSQTPQPLFPPDEISGFEPEKYNEILGLNTLGLNASLVATLGYRHEEDATQHYAKVRKPNEELFITL